MISFRKALWLSLMTAIFAVLVTGCNDTLRQFITPVPAPGGDPGALSHAIVLSTNPATPTASNPALGSNLHIDVSGDSVAGVVPVGPSPRFLGKTTNKVFVLNGDNTVTSYIALLPQNTPVSTVTLPTGTVAVGGGFSNSGNFYVVNSATAPPSPASTNNVGVISSSVSAITATIPVGTSPVAVAGNNANNKIYVVNQGSNNVTVISTIDNFAIGNIQVGTSPVWGVMAPDGVHVFIVNQGSNDVSVIDTLLDQVIATIPVGTSPNYAVFEPANQRLYVSNTGSATISVIKANGIDLANGILPTKIAEIPIPAAADSVAALQDGSRVYAAMGGCPAGTNHTTIIATLASCTGNQVAVIDAQALALKKVLTVGPGAVSIDAANNSSRVYVISANDITTVTDNVTQAPNPPQAPRTFATPSVSIINTASDTVLRQAADPSITTLVPTFHVPQQDPACVPTVDSTFNKTVPLPCPEQVPFVVRIIP
jgi:YVTN family beta-propeller protein